MSESRPRVVAAIVGIVIAVVAGVAIAVTRPPAETEPGTPEAAVQAFAEAVLAGDTETALSLVAPPRPDRLRCNPSPGLRITLGDVNTGGNSARVAVKVTQSSDAGFPGDAYTWDDSFQLERSGEGEDWLLSAWPWALCDMPAKEVAS